MTQLMLIITWLIERVIYVWGASGQNVYIQTVKGAYDPEGWIWENDEPNNIYVPNIYGWHKVQEI